jgi:hypothetical protein
MLGKGSETCGVARRAPGETQDAVVIASMQSRVGTHSSDTHSSKRRKLQGTHRPRDGKYKGHIVQGKNVLGHIVKASIRKQSFISPLIEIFLFYLGLINLVQEFTQFSSTNIDNISFFSDIIDNIQQGT